MNYDGYSDEHIDLDLKIFLFSFDKYIDDVICLNANFYKKLTLKKVF